MANNNIEQYLEAMLAALDGDTVLPDVPSPSWNIEKYLAAILTKLSSGGGSGGGGDVEVAHITIESGEDEQDVYVCDMTVEEIQVAQNNGKTVFCLFNDTLSVWSEVRTVQRDGQSYTVTMISFVAVLKGVELLRWTQFGYRSDGSSDELVVVHNNAYTLTPAT